MIAVDLFCGAGGASLGLHRAGYEVVGYDYWQPAVDTHNANGLSAHLHDLSNPELDDQLPACDLLWASPPCQPFSAAGDGKGEFDDRDGFPWTLRIIGKLLPPVLIIENVKGLTFEKHRPYLDGVLAVLGAFGYKTQWAVLNSADYGVPQTRERCFIIARRDGGPIVWPAPTHTEGDSLFLEPWVTMARALGWEEHTGLILDYQQNNPSTGERIFCNLDNRPSPAVTTKCLRQWRINGRYIALAELVVLQGFPPNWKWTGTKTAQARQVGNAVPPIMAQVLAEANRPVR